MPATTAQMNEINKCFADKGCKIHFFGSWTDLATDIHLFETTGMDLIKMLEAAGFENDPRVKDAIAIFDQKA